MINLDDDIESQLRIFLCHSSGDKPAVRALYEKLRSDEFNPWLDEENLVAGQDWQLEISTEVRNSHIVLVCLSNDSITKRGFVQKEIKYALDVADEQPEGAIFIIPVKLEECDVPQRLRRWHWINYFEAKGYEQLVRALHRRASELESNIRIEIENLCELYIERAISKIRKTLNEILSKKPIVISLVGRTGVGKSSLINALTKGDYITLDATVSTAGITGSYRWQENIILIDMPGLDFAPVDREWEIAKQIEARSDLILYILDSSSRLGIYDMNFIGRILQIEKPLLLIANRIDLVPTNMLRNFLDNMEEMTGLPPIPISTYKRINIHRLRHSITELLGVHEEYSQTTSAPNYKELLEKEMKEKLATSRKINHDF